MDAYTGTVEFMVLRGMSEARRPKPSLPVMTASMVPRGGRDGFGGDGCRGRPGCELHGDREPVLAADVVEGRGAPPPRHAGGGANHRLRASLRWPRSVVLFHRVCAVDVCADAACSVVTTRRPWPRSLRPYPRCFFGEAPGKRRAAGFDVQAVALSSGRVVSGARSVPGGELERQVLKARSEVFNLPETDIVPDPNHVAELVEVRRLGVAVPHGHGHARMD